MIRWIVGGSLKFRLLVIPVAVALMIVGVNHARNARVDVLPEYSLPYVQIQTESLGLSASEVEQLLTVPLEQDLLNGVKGVETIRSSSIPGLSSITLVFERGTNIRSARQLVAERLAQPQAIPSVSAAPQMIQPVSATNRVMMIALSSKRLSPIQLGVLARWTVRPRLMGIPGVANVALWGHRDRQLQVLVDPKRLRARDVSLLQVVKTAGNAQLVSPLTFLNASTPGTGGFVDGANQRLGVRHVLPFGAPRDLAQVPIERSSGPPLPLGDVATLVEDHQPLIGDSVVAGAGANDSLLLVVEKLPGVNTLELTRKLDDALGELRPGLSGIQIDAAVFRPATFIESAIDHLELALIIAAALVALALAAFLLRWRAVLISLVAIPLSLITAVFVLDLTGATINALVVVGLVVALGAVVGDAVGDVQSMAARMRERREAEDGGSAAGIILRSSLQVRSAMGYATLILLLFMVPVFFLGGATGAFLHPLALSYGLAVLASMLVALTVTPALGLALYGGTAGGHREAPPMAWLRRGVAAGVSRFTASPRLGLLTLCGFLVAGLATLPFLAWSLHPSFKDRELLVRWNATPSTSLPEMHRITTRATDELRSIPGVSDVGAHVGRAITSDQVVGTGSGEMWVTIDPSADYDSTLRSVRRVVAGYPGVRGNVLTYENDRSGGVLQRRDPGLVVRLYGQELGTLNRSAGQLKNLVSQVDGVRNARVQSPTMQPTLQIEADLTASRRHGVKPGDVRRAAAMLVQGLDVGAFFEEQKVFQVIVRGVPATRHSVQSVRDLVIDTPSGGHVRLGDVARVRIAPNPVDIRHDAVSRYTDVRADVAGRDLGDVQADVERRIRRLSLPLEYHAEVIRQSEDEVSPVGRLLTLALAAAVGVYLLLQAAFGSWRLASLVFVTLPLALVGGLLVVLVGGGDLSLGAVVGLVTVLGIAARNGVMLIRHLQALEAREGEASGRSLVPHGIEDGMAPIVLTTVATALALLPFALLGDVAGNELTHSTAAVVLGGLVTATVLDLFVLPSLYLHLTPGTRAAREEEREAEGSRVAGLDLVPGT
jgi:Cu/Ag efflux pump CusA